MYASDLAASDNFGRSVSLYRHDTALIGAINGDDDNSKSSGSVYVFTRSNTDGMFTQQSKIHAEGDAAVEDWFGRSVSLYGDIALIGAKIDDSVLYLDLYTCLLVRTDDGTFTEQSTLYASDPENDRFGISVSLYGDTALIGTMQMTITAKQFWLCLLVYSFEHFPMGRLHNSINSTRMMADDNDHFGYSVLYTATRR